MNSLLELLSSQSFFNQLAVSFFFFSKDLSRDRGPTMADTLYLRPCFEKRSQAYVKVLLILSFMYFSIFFLSRKMGISNLDVWVDPPGPLWPRLEKWNPVENTCFGNFPNFKSVLELLSSAPFLVDTLYDFNQTDFFRSQMIKWSCIWENWIRRSTNSSYRTWSNLWMYFLLGVMWALQI